MSITTLTFIHCGSNNHIIKILVNLPHEFLLLLTKEKNYEEPLIVFIFVVWDYIEQINLATVIKVLESRHIRIHFKSWTPKGFAELWWTRTSQFFGWVSCHNLLLFMWLVCCFIFKMRKCWNMKMPRMLKWSLD